MSATLDPFILERAPGPLVDLPDSLIRARAAFRAALESMSNVTDDELTYLWLWDGKEANVRYGFYRVFEVIEAATSNASRAIAGSPDTEARDAVAATTASRWALQGVLATLTDAEFDAETGNGEWSIHRTMQHIVNSQRGYAWGSAAWLEVGISSDLGDRRLSDDLWVAHPEEEEEATGSLAEVRRELDDIVDATASRYATLTEDEMRVMGRWYGFPVTMAFRQWRWSSHIEEHSVQIEKTIDLLGLRRSEVNWLTRMNARAFGRLEGVVFGRATAGAASAILDEVALQLDDLGRSVSAAAEAAAPGPEDF